MNRVAGADESYALAERLFGWTAPIQYLWVYPREPGPEVIDALNDQLAAGAFNRKVVPARVPVARDRWVRVEPVPPVHGESAPIADDAVGAWVDRRLRQADLDPAAGRGWKLEHATTTSGRFVLTLLVSHMIADGQAVYNALARAHAGTSKNALPHPSEVAGTAGLRGDVADAIGQIGAAGKALRVLIKPLWEGRKTMGGSPTRDTAPGAGSASGPDTTLAIVDLDKAEWTARAIEYGGTANSLFTALLGGLLRRSGYPMGPDGTKICIAVSNRIEGDERANASGGVWIRVPGPIGPEAGLREIRALSKTAFAEYAHADDTVADNLQTVARLLPDTVLGGMMRSIAGPDVTVSNLGAAPESALCLGDLTAESFGIRAIMQGRNAADRRTQGPAIAAWAVEYGDKVTVTFFGISPDWFGDTDVLRKSISAELAEWSLSHTFW
ncbi:hypothetical protein GCM10007304_28530 [Rhodococcoides trifolii]|uniref:Diacylglycerol O-acyltransferase n=1 Tax=Rhodococcoides trifolii TaxID=908250 RepID=A0A917FXM1_9NOCA|nr:hypothetical protein [Rhodococcus trifolii]GGG12838.1 hypothetical protein GCM10007304_28530 [Rhodococcus trifolii]